MSSRIYVFSSPPVTDDYCCSFSAMFSVRQGYSGKIVISSRFAHKLKPVFIVRYCFAEPPPPRS